MKITIKLEPEDANNIERLYYEVYTCEKIIDMHTTICNSHDLMDTLHDFIQDYDESLRMNIPHKLMLEKEIVNKYFPFDKISDKNKATYDLDIHNGEITYYYDS